MSVYEYTPLEHPLMIDALLPLRALPDHARKTLQRHQRLAGIGPLLQFLDGDMIERLAGGSAGKKRGRDGSQMRPSAAVASKRTAATPAKTCRGALPPLTRTRHD